MSVAEPQFLTYENINLWAVVVAWLINMAVGAFWYSPAGFAGLWKKYTGIDIMKIPQNEATRTLLFVSLSALIQAAALGLIISTLDPSSWIEGSMAGFVLWLGFTAATTVGVTLYSRRSWKFLWLNSSYFLVVMLLNSIIFTIW